MYPEAFFLRSLVTRALKEDLGAGDLTTALLFSAEKIVTGNLLAKEKGTVAGLQVAFLVFQTLDPAAECQAFKSDGEEVLPGEVLACIKGTAHAVLGGERTALNFLQRMSGIATLTARYVEEVKGYPVKILDTRKTAPGLRLLDKYAVRTGGGFNHRFGLDEAVLIKDNHLEAAGGITVAIKKIRERLPVTAKIEVEVRKLDEVAEALHNHVDLIMLDNMPIEDVRSAVALVNKRCLLEASGNISLANVREVAATGVDYISVGELTHSPRALDLSLKL